MSDAPEFDLAISADYPNRTAEFSLRAAGGVGIACRNTDFKTFSSSEQRALFDLQDYPRFLSWTGASTRFTGFLARRDDDAD